jgi:hypothetical protein
MWNNIIIIDKWECLGALIVWSVTTIVTSFGRLHNSQQWGSTYGDWSGRNRQLFMSTDIFNKTGALR